MDRFSVTAVFHRVLGYAASIYPIKTSAILNFHSVRDLPPGALNWIRSLTVSPAFVERLIVELRHQNVSIVSLPEAIDRSNSLDSRPFVAFTFDDGYADNFHRAFPIFQRYEAPFTIFLSTGLIDRTVPMWWSILQFLVETNDYLVLPERVIMARNTHEKNSALTTNELSAAFTTGIPFSSEPSYCFSIVTSSDWVSLMARKALSISYFRRSGFDF